MLLAEHSLQHVVVRDRQPFLFDNSRSGHLPIRSDPNLYKHFLFCECISLLVWLQLGGGLDLVVSGEACADIDKAIEALTGAGIISAVGGTFALSNQPDTAVDYTGIAKKDSRLPTR